MEFSPIDTSEFLGRDERLRRIERFRGLADAPPKFPIMFHRTNLSIHSDRVQWLIETMLPDLMTIFPDLNPERCRTIAKVHDDPETDPNWGDVQLADKEHWSKEKLELNHQQELASIAYVAANAPSTINGFNYEDLMREAAEKETLEAQLVSFADKFDGYGEGCHEVYGGNARFIGVWQGYTKRLQAFTNLFPRLAPIRTIDKVPFNPPTEYDYRQIAKGKRYHTPESILRVTGNPHYDFWRKVTIEKGKEKGRFHLLTRMESYGDIS